MTDKEKLEFLERMMVKGNTTIGQVIMDNHGTMNYFADGRKNSEQASPHFPLNKSEDVGRQWYDFLTAKGFIPTDTEQECWLYGMGFSSKEPLEPKPIVWLKTVETAQMMMRKVCDNLLSTNQLSIAGMFELASQCFTKNGKPLKLAKQRKEVSSDADLIENFVPTISDL